MKTLLFLLLTLSAAAQTVTSTTVPVNTNMVTQGKGTTFFNVNLQYQKLANMAALRALPITLVPDGSGIEVLGYYSAGDGGGGTYVLTNTVAGTNAFGGRVLAVGGAKSWQLINDSVVNPSQFGAIPNDLLDDQPGIQAASTYLASRMLGTNVIGGTLKFDPGEYRLSTSVICGARQTWTSDAEIAYTDYEYWLGTQTNAFSAGSTRLVQLFSTNQPLIVVNNSDTRMPLRYDAIIQEDGTYASSSIISVTFKNLVFIGTAYNFNSPVFRQAGCDGIYAENVWGVTIDNCFFHHFTGHAIHLRNVAAGRIKNNLLVTYFRGQNNIVLWGCNDTEVRNNIPQGGFGPRIWVTGNSCLGNMIQGNMAGAAFDQTFEGGGTCPVTNIVGGTVLELSRPHRLVTGSLVEIMATNYNQIPSGTSGRVYYAINLGDSSLSLATTMSNALAGTAVSMGALTTNTWICPGPAAGLYASWSSGSFTIDNNRFDRNFASGVILRDTLSVNIVGNNFLQNCYDFGNNAPSGFAQGSAISIISPCLDTAVNGNQFTDYGGTAQKRAVTVWDNVQTTAGAIVRMGVNSSSVGALAAQATNAWGLNNTNYTELPVLTLGTNFASSPIYFPSLSAGRVSSPISVPATDSVPTQFFLTNSVGSNTFGFGLFSSKRAFFTGGFGLTLLSFDEFDTNNSIISTGPRNVILTTGTRSGADLTGYNFEIRSGAGTGAATNSIISFLTPLVGSSGSAVQSQVKRAQIDSTQADRDTSLWLWNRDTGTLRRVGATNLTAGGVTLDFLYLKP